MAYCGHGPPAPDPAAAFARALRRLDGWRDTPERMAWHGVKRVFVYGLMIENGLDAAAVLPYLLACPWLHDYAAYPFDRSAEAFAALVREEVLRSGAARWESGRLVSAAPFVPPPPGWLKAPANPACWPR